jgi:hypothetical protein
VRTDRNDLSRRDLVAVANRSAFAQSLIGLGPGVAHNEHLCTAEDIHKPTQRQSIDQAENLKMSTRIKTTTLTVLGLSAILLAAPFTTVSAEEAASEHAHEAPAEGMSGMQGMKPSMKPMGGTGGMMSPEMMQKKQEMMKQHMAKMEGHMANIEALLRELVELNKAK